MGLDFIRKTTKSFRKRLDQSLIELGTPDLFDKELECEPRTYTATILSNKNLHPGEEVSIYLRDNKIIAQRCMEPIAVFVSPPKEVFEALQESYGEAYGTIQEVYESAATAEITIC